MFGLKRLMQNDYEQLINKKLLLLLIIRYVVVCTKCKAHFAV